MTGIDSEGKSTALLLSLNLHVFDTNARRNVSRTIAASSNDLHCKQFRKGLAMCQKAMTEDELGRLWSDSTSGRDEENRLDTSRANVSKILRGCSPDRNKKDDRRRVEVASEEAEHDMSR